MKAISIRQPWAWLIIQGGKDIENRNWSTNVRGRVLVHAAKGMTKDEYADTFDFAKYVRFKNDAKTTPLAIPTFNTIERGGIIGSVEIADCVKSSVSPWFMGHFGFVLRDPRPMPFIPWRGALGFFVVPDDVIKP